MPDERPSRIWYSGTVDICKLDYVRLGKVAQRVDGAIRHERCRRFTKGRVKELLSTAVGQGRIDPKELADSLRHEIAP